MTAGRPRPPQDTISSNILDTTRVQTAINHDINQCKAITSLFKFNFDVFNFTQSYVMPVPLPQDVTNRHRAQQDTIFQ